MTLVPAYVFGVMRFLFLLAVLASTATAATATDTDTAVNTDTAARERIIGTVQPEIRLENGTVFKNAKVLDASPEKGTATLSDSTRIRTVPLQQLPSSLREQVLEEIARGDGPRFNLYREPVRPPPPPDKVIPPVTIPPVTPTITDQLIARATEETADELKFYLLRSFERVGSLTTKIRKVEQVPGWQKIRASGDASFSVWDNSRRDYVWRTEKFEVEFAIVNGTALKLDTVTFGGISRSAEID